MNVLTQIAPAFRVKPPTQIEIINHEREETQRQVCQLLQVREDYSAENVYLTGIDFINLYYATASGMALAAERSKLFWSWWKLEWQVRDDAFLADKLGDIALEYRRRIYIDLHNPNVLADCTFPGREVTTEIFAIAGRGLLRQKTA